MERRKHPRIHCNAAGSLYIGSECVACMVQDVSHNGLALLCARTEPPGTFVRVQWHSFSGALADADGVVVRIRPHPGGGHTWGLSLIRLAPQVALEIDAQLQGFPMPQSSRPPARPSVPARSSSVPARSSSVPSPYHSPSGTRPVISTSPPPRRQDSGSYRRVDPDDPLSQPPISKRELHALYRAALAQQKSGSKK